ncbi:unnamed protein product [Xylocopa violacea]|uniref:Reverse transcriptase domain-containing protein n=1 Tax=Xylocopa violacea TaxID=135666 RepID=A0ABP1N6F7_XYLVO
MVLLDVQKAFDTVWTLKLTKIIQNFLEDRTHNPSIHIKQTPFSTHHIPAGVPQGSVLGPILFNIYINDISTSNKVHTDIYADYTVLFTSKTATTNLQTHLNAVTDHFTNWKLTVNPDKTKAILFTFKKFPPPPCLTIPNQQITWHKTVKYLGLQLDSKLTWKHAIQDRVRKTTHALKTLYPLIGRGPIPIAHKIHQYKACARPIPTYGAQVWGTAATSHILKAQRTQNKCLRTITGKNTDYNIKKLHSDTKTTFLVRHINNFTKNTIHKLHQNPLVNSIANYDINEIPLKNKTNYPKLPSTQLTSI